MATDKEKRALYRFDRKLARIWKKERHSARFEALLQKQEKLIARMTNTTC